MQVDEIKEWNHISKKERMAIIDIAHLHKLLNSQNIQHWLTSGSLLGSVTRNWMLPNDRDIDIGIWDRDRGKLRMLLPKFRKLGFNIRQRYDPAHDMEKGMVTIKRGIAPIDIKIYKKYGDYAARGINRSLSLQAEIVWELIDMLYYKNEYDRLLPSTKLRRVEHHLFCLTSKIMNIYPFKSRASLVCYLSEIWRRLDSWYGMEILPLKYFKEFKKTKFLGTEFDIFKNAEEYLNEEYGYDWSKHNPNGKGGIEKYSHILFNKQLFKEIQNDTELFKRAKAVGYINK